MRCATDQLTVKDDRLYFKGDLLVCVHPAGDCDTIPWPLTSSSDAKNLASALYDLGNTRDDLSFPITINLPDGRLFGRLVACGFNPDFDFNTLPENE